MVTLLKKGPGFALILANSTYVRHIPAGGAAIVRIQLTNKRGIPVEPFNVNRDTGRIILRSEGITIGAGTYTLCWLRLIRRCYYGIRSVK
jgi:hypothetical protein